MTAPTPTFVTTTDIAIIGAGPVGLFGVFAAGMLGLKAHVFDALPAIGGQCTALYPQKPIYDIPAYPHILAGDLITALTAQAAPFAPTYHLGAPVTAITQSLDGSFTLQAGTTTPPMTARAVLIACGAGAFGPNRPPIAGLAPFEGQSVFYAVDNPGRFKDQQVVIAGGGDSAVDWAVHLAEIAKTVTLVHRRGTFRAAPASLQKLDALVNAGRVRKMVPYQLDGVVGTDGHLDQVILKDLDGTPTSCPAQALLCFFGLSTNLGILGDIGLAVEGHTIVIDPTTGATSHAGIFAAGDGVTYAHKQKLILTGFAEISQAAQAIYRHLNPGQDIHHVHSTTRGVPGQTPL